MGDNIFVGEGHWGGRARCGVSVMRKNKTLRMGSLNSTGGNCHERNKRSKS